MDINEIDFTVKPYEGVGPINFGMSKKEVEKILGKPDTSNKDFLGRIDERRGSMSVKYSKDKAKVNELSFWDGFNVFLGNLNLLNASTALDDLKKIEKPFDTVGYKVFFTIGVAVTGFSKKKDQKTVSVFSKELEPMWRM